MEKHGISAFDDIPHTVRGHFLLNFYAAVYRLINHIRRLDINGEDLEKTFKKYPFLEGYFKEMLKYMPEEVGWEDALGWWETEITEWEKASKVHLPLLSLAEHADIDFHSRIALLIAGLVEEDSRFGTLFARLQEPLEHRRPCLELAGQIMMDGGFRDHWSICSPLLSAGLIDVINKDAPRSEWELRISSILWDAVRGRIDSCPSQWCRYHPSLTFPPVKELIFPDEFLRKLGQIPALVAGGKAHSLILRSMHGSESVQAIGSVARTLNMNVIEVLDAAIMNEQHWGLLGPLCSLTGSLPVIKYDLGPGETAELPQLGGYKGPLGIIMGFEGGLRGHAAEKAVALTLPQSRAAHRMRHWEEALAGHPVENLSLIVERFHIPGGYIRQAASIAVAHAALNGRDIITASDIREACRTLNRQLLDALAARLEVEGSWDLLVVSDTVRSKLKEMESRCRHRERILDHLGTGFGSSCNRGVRALFTGASGTGKTFAAKILAAELGMDLYRVDLAAIVNKYIGETEKNLHRVLSRAEELDVILLLDEADALLGSRTDVKSANDRYANLETNYLLQRLENYQGIVVMTTNAVDYVDRAFQRRMDVVVNFAPPRAEERWRIWRLHLPKDYAVDNSFLEEVAVKCALTGGQIRNAALHAILLALDEDSGIVTRSHLEKAVQSEYRKAGATCPLKDKDLSREQFGSVEAFLDALLQ